MVKRHQVLLCGLGRAGMIHLSNCRRNPQIDLTHVVEIDLEKASEQLEIVGEKDNVQLVHYNDIDSVLKLTSLKGVIIATVTYTHEEIVKKCIQYGKAIFCEKPVAENISSIKSCYEEAEKAGVALFCAFNRRFDPTHRAVMERSHSGDVGTIQCIKTCSRDSPLPSMEYLRISGGIYHDCGVHDIDVVMSILRETPVSVFSFAHAFHEEIKAMNDVDTVSITMKFASGAIAHIDLSRLAAYGYDQRVEVFGSKGMLQSNNPSKTSVVHSNGDGIKGDVNKYSFPTRYDESYQAELRHFVDVMEGAQPSVSKNDVLLVSLVASACETSQKEGRVVHIDKEKMTFH